MNPWNVESLEEFLYFCCPECDLKDTSKVHFLQHALEQHPNAKECVQQFNEFIIKEEPHEKSNEEDIKNDDNISDIFENSYNLAEEYCEMLKCEIKIENKDHENNLNFKFTSEDKSNDCESCGKTFESFSMFKRHIDICKKDQVLVNLVEKSELCQLPKFSQHRASVWKEITDKFNEITGNNCDSHSVSKRYKNYQYQLSLKKSKPLKDEKLLEEYKCDFCGVAFKTNIKLKSHIDYFHKDQKCYRCDICVKTFNKECYLETHYKKVHGIVNKQTCEFCNKEFDKKSKLAIHIKSIHKKGFSVVCDLCGKSFTHSGTLKKHHKSVHEGIKEHFCVFCNKAFSESTDLRKHIKCVHEGVKDHVCDLCGQTFGMHWALKRHVKNIHDGIKDHPCTQCDKAFSNAARLNHHVSTVHEGKKKHKCNICERRFVKPSKLKIHIKNVHPGVDLGLT